MKLEVNNINKVFGENHVLKDVSFEVNSGRALGLLGRNGAGKTTTIRIIMDVFHANSGEVLLDGKKFNQREHMIGYLPEERGLYPKKTVMEQLIYLGRIRGLSKAEATANTMKWLKKLEVQEYALRKLETLSKGNQQKVQLASTLVCDPEIVILDEPFSGLDPVNSRILQKVVMEIIKEGKIVIFSSHQMSYVEEFCEDIAIINKGEVVLSGSLDEIKKEYGKNQLLIEAVNYNNQELKEVIEAKFADSFEVKGVTKKGVIIRYFGDMKRNEMLSLLMSKGIEIEAFETYKPSLNDIFVSRVGEEETVEEFQEGKDGANK
ncbi:MAG: ABC transporter ATP-binding protein [Lachnospira sp.]